MQGGQIAKNNLKENITRNKSYSVQKSMAQALMYHLQWVNSNMLTWRCQKTSAIVVTSYKWDNKVLAKNGAITRESLMQRGERQRKKLKGRLKQNSELVEEVEITAEIEIALEEVETSEIETDL